MVIVLPELDLMVLERVRGVSLRTVARVNKTWRKRIENNIHRMRQMCCEQLTLIFESNNTVSISVLDEKLYRYRPDYVPGKRIDKIDEECNSLDYILKYIPTESVNLYLCNINSPETMRQQVANMLKSIPDWWTKQIKKIDCAIYDTMFCRFVFRLSHISTLRLFGSNWSMELLKNVIKCTQQVDYFFIGRNADYDRSVLVTIVEKSHRYPTEFPLGLKSISLRDFTRALELINFTGFEHHTIKAEITEGQGTVAEWLYWLNNNATPLSVYEDNMPQSSFYKQSIYTFTYRGMRFCVELLFILS